MDKICGGKGEGVMLKDPKCSYERKRSYKLLKVKRFEDAEATVYGHQGGTGRISGMCGALLVEEKDGTKFKIGSGFDDSQQNVATLFSNKPYGTWFHGKVVDMFYFPIWQGNLPSWLPIWGGKEFTFFNAIFNIAIKWRNRN
jgi:ATP-dependent DNA ligase